MGFVESLNSQQMVEYLFREGPCLSPRYQVIRNLLNPIVSTEFKFFELPINPFIVRRLEFDLHIYS